MDRQEVMTTRYGEMLDMISCLSIYNGGAEYKAPRRKLTWEEMEKVR